MKPIYGYISGFWVSIALAYPSQALIDQLFDAHPGWDDGYIDDEDIANSLLYAFDNRDHRYLIDDPGSGEVTLNDENDVFDDVSGSTGNVLAAEMDIHSELFSYLGPFFKMLNYYQAPSPAAARTTRANDGSDQARDVKTITDMIHLTKIKTIHVRQQFHKVWLSDPDIYEASVPLMVSYEIYPIHVYRGEQDAGDYYFTKMTASVPFYETFRGKDANYHGGVRVRWCGAYGKKFYVRSKLLNANGSELASAAFPASGFPQPSTTIGQTSYTNSSSFGIKLGISGEAGKGKEKEIKGKLDLSFSWDWTDSETRSISDVDIVNITSGSNAGLQMVFNHLPEYKWSEDFGFDLGSSHAYRGSGEIHGTWIWYIPNTPDDVEGEHRKIDIDMKAFLGFQTFYTTKVSLDEFEWTLDLAD